MDVPGACGRGGPPISIPAWSLSTDLGFHGPEINKRAKTAITTTATMTGQRILLILFSLLKATRGCGCLGGTRIRGADLERVASGNLDGSGNLFNLRKPLTFGLPQIRNDIVAPVAAEYSFIGMSVEPA